MSALDLRTRVITWTNRRRAPQVSATLATAGGLLFEGSRDRSFRALDSGSGKTLWQVNSNDMPNGYPISFSVGNMQYVSIIAGGGTPFDFQHRDLAPEIADSSGARTIWVFQLAGSP